MKSKLHSVYDVQTGDDFLVRGDSFLSRSICKVMRKWAKQKGYTDLIPLTMSHAARFVSYSDMPNIPLLYGSTESGYKAIEFDKHYDWDEDEFVIMRRKGGLNKEEKARVIRYCLHLATVNIFYQYWNLIQWLLLVYLHTNTFWKDREAFTYCYESCYLSRKNLDPEEYKDCKNPDVFMLLSDSNYEIIYISEALERKLKPKNQQL